MSIPTVRQSIARKSKTWYMSGVNMCYSFKSLENLAKQLGADVSDGDTLIVDNDRKDKRKAFRKTRNGCIILYAQQARSNKFIELRDGDGEVSSRNRQPLIDYFK